MKQRGMMHVLSDRRPLFARVSASLLTCVGLTCVGPVSAEVHVRPNDVAAEFVTSHCLDCHSGTGAERGLDLEWITTRETDAELDDRQAAVWERMIRRMEARQMPPPDASKPTEADYKAALSAMASFLDDRAAHTPRPGRTETLRRLTRVEYQNAVRDLLSLRVDAAELLPKDESSLGFDNITVTELSPTLLNRYIAAAEAISRRAIGVTEDVPDGATYRLPPDRTQEKHTAGLPLGTRGGTLIEHHFTRPGEYQIRLRLARDRDEKVEGLDAEHQVDVLLDRRRVHQFTVRPPAKSGNSGDYNRDYSKVDAHLVTRFDVTAGPHQVGVAFVPRSDSVREIKRQPFDASYNRHRHPRQSPALYEVSIVGPLAPEAAVDEDTVGEAGAKEDRGRASSVELSDPTPRTPSRQRVFGDLGLQNNQEPGRDEAKRVLRRLARRAYRRPVTDADLKPLMVFYDSAGGFEAGVQNALAAVLVNPHFLFRVEQDPDGVAPDTPYALGDVALASRLSFFLWSSLPDDELLSLAEAGDLNDPAVLRAQANRMLADDRSHALVANFASQWLQLRNLASITPDLRQFPDFDDNLRAAMRGETEHVFAEIVREDRSVLELLRRDTTYLNERLATHYGVPHVKGSHFRKVVLPAGSHRGGLLRHAGVLTVTSYATRTSPTIRGNWVLEKLLGTPAPPPPPNVPALKEKETFEALTVRERLARHREDPACAGCHNLMDPIGFALDNFDAVGRWRDFEGEQRMNVSGTLPDGQNVGGVDDLEAAILSRPELFVTALTETLMTYALGRGVGPNDGPAVRKIVRQAADNDYRFSAIVDGLVNSVPFRMRRAAGVAVTANTAADAATDIQTKESE